MWVELRQALTVTALVLAMLLSGVIGVRQRIGTLTLALISFAWLTVDAKWEGGTLIHLSHSHALTRADLVGFAGLAVAAWQLWHHHRAVTRTVTRVVEQPERAPTGSAMLEPSRRWRAPMRPA